MNSEQPVKKDQPMVSLQHVSKYYGDHHVLKDVSLDIERSTVCAFIGPSGAGKSTLIRSVNALEGIQGGRILIDGLSVHDRSTNLNKLRADIGFVAQSFNLYPHLKILDNVTLAPRYVRRLPREQCEERAVEILASLGLKDKVSSYPAQLSGGQQQRVAIARALAMEPNLVLFDEPTSALDPELIKEVLDSMRLMAEMGMTMMVVTHEMGFAREVCSQIAFMADGEILELTTPDQFFSNPQSERAKEFLNKIISH